MQKMNCGLITIFGVLATFSIGCTKNDMPKRGRTTGGGSSIEMEMSKENNKRDKEDQEFQNYFKGKKWVVLSVEEDNERDSLKKLLFLTLEGGYFSPNPEAVSVVFDKSLNGTYLVVSGVSRDSIFSSYHFRNVSGAILYVNTRVSEVSWNKYLRDLNKRIEKSVSPRQILPPK